MRPLALILLLIALVPIGTGMAASRLTGPLPARVLSVVDGDTLAVRVTVWLDQEVVTRVRLNGIDTPESRSTCADEKRMAAKARERLTSLVASAMDGKGDQVVLLHNVVHDKYGGRVRAEVRLADGTDIATALIRDGLARAYQGGKRQPWCSGGTIISQVDEADEG